ncbi:M56 family metallopeptidase [Clostridium kluyveri]|uniref:Peptidase n=1 Tax=Clostridium kluyveri TaxID=1534 RepID=A0A1L5F3V2_CLOKL|nr:M56 family metallopeptidase [Clostridium kluyveri]APM37676.1 peptidase [Clostridium kluyveri]
MIEIFMKNLLKTSLTGSIIIILILILRKTLFKRYTSAFNYYIWLAVILKMIMPFKIPIYIPEKISNTFQHAPNNVKTIIDSGISLNESMKIKNSPNIITGSYPMENYFTILFYIWLIVSVIFLAYYIISYIIFNNKIKHFTYDVPDSEIRNIYSELLVEMNIKRKISLKFCRGISTPLGIGIFNSCILIPSVLYNTQELKYILKHELMHYKKYDMMYKLLVLIISSMHWFNPMVYVMCREINKDCELSCDEAVLEKSDMEERKLYASALVNSIRLNKNNTLKQNLITGFNNKNILKGRLKNMFNLKKRKKGVLIGILVVMVIIVSLISVNIFSKDDGSDKINTKGQLLQPKKVVENYIKYLNQNDKKAQKNLVTKDYASIIWGKGSKDTKNIKYINYIKIKSISEETNPFQKKSYLENGRGRRNGATEENVKIYKIEYISVDWVFHRDKETKWFTVIRKDKNSTWLIDGWGE